MRRDVVVDQQRTTTGLCQRESVQVENAVERQCGTRGHINGSVSQQVDGQLEFVAALQNVDRRGNGLAVCSKADCAQPAQGIGLAVVEHNTTERDVPFKEYGTSLADSRAK